MTRGLRLKYWLLNAAIRLGLLLTALLLVLALVPLGLAEALCDGMQRMLTVRSLAHMNRLLRLRQRVHDARERTDAGIKICGEAFL
jgi:hypothetical protein